MKKFIMLLLVIGINFTILPLTYFLSESKSEYYLTDKGIKEFAIVIGVQIILFVFTPLRDILFYCIEGCINDED